MGKRRRASTGDYAVIRRDYRAKAKGRTVINGGASKRSQTFLIPFAVRRRRRRSRTNNRRVFDVRGAHCFQWTGRGNGRDRNVWRTAGRVRATVKVSGPFFFFRTVRNGRPNRNASGNSGVGGHLPTRMVEGRATRGQAGKRPTVRDNGNGTRDPTTAFQQNSRKSSNRTNNGGANATRTLRSTRWGWTVRKDRGVRDR